MSDLSKALDEYLQVRRILGFKLLDTGSRLRKFVSFLEARGESVITTQLAVAWSQQDPDVQPAQWATNLSKVRLFAQYCSGLEPRTEIPPANVFPYQYRRKSPHIYTPEEITRLLDAAGNLRPQNGLRPHTHATLFGLLISTGLRISEAMGLHRDDVDFAKGVLLVRQTKFCKSRLIPLHATTLEALQSYARRRDRLHPIPDTPWFFVTQRGKRLSEWDLRTTFIQLSRQIGIRGENDHHGPRMHDFRHSFAVATLLRWYEEGEDVERKLPLLSTYLGHAHPEDTYWYLSATPELLGQATARLEKALGGQS